MNQAVLSVDQTDALSEVVNIAMGQAGDSLASILDSFIVLSTPRVQFVKLGDLGLAIEKMVGRGAVVTAVRQGFFPDFRGEALMLFDETGCREMAELMGYSDDASDSFSAKELLLDVANVLVGAVLNGITETLGIRLSFSAPVIMADQVPVDTLIDPSDLSWAHSLLVEVNFSLEERDFRSHLMLLLADDAIDPLRQCLDEILNDL